MGADIGTAQYRMSHANRVHVPCPLSIHVTMAGKTGKFIANVTVEADGCEDAAAAVTAIRDSVAWGGRMDDAGGVGSGRAHRISVDIDVSWNGRVSVALQGGTVAGPGGVSPERINAALVAPHDAMGSFVTAPGGVSVQVDGMEGGGRMEIYVGVCSEVPATSETEKRIRDAF